MKELEIINNPKGFISESVKTIRANIQFLSVDKDIKTILITSSVPSEGKSFISANLGASFAQIDKKVLIIDSDMRRGRQHNIFDIKAENGLSSLISSSSIDKDKNVVKTNVENLCILPVGIIPPNPTEMLSSNKFKKLLKSFKEDFDIIIIDGVPLNGLSDSLIVAELVDKIILVTALKQTPSNLVKDSVMYLEKFQDKVAGVIVNKAPISNDKYYSSYYTSGAK